MDASVMMPVMRTVLASRMPVIGSSPPLVAHNRGFPHPISHPHAAVDRQHRTQGCKAAPSEARKLIAAVTFGLPVAQRDRSAWHLDVAVLHR